MELRRGSIWEASQFGHVSAVCSWDRCSQSAMVRLLDWTASQTSVARRERSEGLRCVARPRGARQALAIVDPHCTADSGVRGH